MSDISNVLTEENVNVIDMSMKMNQHLAVIKLVLGVKGIPSLAAFSHGWKSAQHL